MEEKRTYVPYTQWKEPSIQREYTQETPLLDDSGKLIAKGWARRNLFTYDRDKVRRKGMSRKEWDFYQISDGKCVLQMNFANVSLFSYISCKFVDMRTGEVWVDSMEMALPSRRKHISPPKGDVPNLIRDKIGPCSFEFDTRETSRTLKLDSRKKKVPIRADIAMDIPEGLENITTVLPFDEDETRYFMTTKQNCMPCCGTFTFGDRTYTFGKEESFATLDWGRVNSIHEMVWYWGNGSTYLTDGEGKKHLFGFEITWAIGNEQNATETALFYDGKLHKFGAVDVEVFPKPDKYMEPWHFLSEDGRFDMTMVPTFDHQSLSDVGIAQMNTHQVHGLWSGKAILDDGTVLEIKDMYAFCEYVENKW